MIYILIYTLMCWHGINSSHGQLLPFQSLEIAGNDQVYVFELQQVSSCSAIGRVGDF